MIFKSACELSERTSKLNHFWLESVEANNNEKEKHIRAMKWFNELNICIFVPMLHTKIQLR